MKHRPKLAMTWLSGCGGCEEALLDVGLELTGLLERADVVYWPIAADGRRKDLERAADGEIEASFVNGAVRTDEHVETVRLLRRKSRIVVSHGSCAHLGGVYGLANLFRTEALLERSYGDARFGREGGEGPSLPRLLERVQPLGEVVKVDVVVPGCPPVPPRLKEALTRVVEGTLDGDETVLADERALCDTCPRAETRRPDTRIRRFRRVHEMELDPGLCFLEQGVVCLGPATRGGCEARCVRGNLPCRGCFGPVPNVRDPGSAAVGFLSGLVEGASVEELEKAIKSLPDPAGLFYRYSLPSSVLGGGSERGEGLDP